MSDDLTHDKVVSCLEPGNQDGLRKTHIIASQVYRIGDGCAAHYKG